MSSARIFFCEACDQEARAVTVNGESKRVVCPHRGCTADFNEFPASVPKLATAHARKMVRDRLRSSCRKHGVGEVVYGFRVKLDSCG